MSFLLSKEIFLNYNVTVKIIHVSYNRARPAYTDPRTWIKFLSFFSGVLEALSRFAEVIVIQHISYTGVVEHKGVSYHFPELRNWQLWMPFKLNAYIRELRPDVIVVHGLVFPGQVLLLRWQLGSRVSIIAQHHAEPPLRYIRKIFQLLADRHIKAYLFASLDLGLKWVKKGQIRDARKIKEVMEASSTFSPMSKETARKITMVSGQKVFLWVGRLDANKDPLTVVKAFISLTRTNPEVRLYMIFQTDEFVDELRAMISTTSKASKSIHLVGRVDHSELQYWYSSVDFIVSGSHYEGSGIAVCEAMSCGCIPVLTDIPPFRMMTDNGGLGALYQAGDADALLSALRQSLALNPEDQKRKVLQRFNDELSFQAIARKIMSVINELDICK